MPTIFVPNKSPHDFSDALRYGSLQFVTTGTIGKNAITAMYRAWELALSDSTDDDYILITSLTTLCAIGTAIFAVKHGKINILIYRNSRYYARTIKLKGD